MTNELKTEIGVSSIAWLFILFSKLTNALPELQVIAVLFAIISSAITIMINLPKLFRIFVQTFKKLIK